MDLNKLSKQDRSAMLIELSINRAAKQARQPQSVTNKIENNAHNVIKRRRRRKTQKNKFIQDCASESDLTHSDSDVSIEELTETEESKNGTIDTSSDTSDIECLTGLTPEVADHDYTIVTRQMAKRFNSANTESIGDNVSISASIHSFDHDYSICKPTRRRINRILSSNDSQQTQDQSVIPKCEQSLSCAKSENITLQVNNTQSAVNDSENTVILENSQLPTPEQTRVLQCHVQTDHSLQDVANSQEAMSQDIFNILNSDSNSRDLGLFEELFTESECGIVNDNGVVLTNNQQEDVNNIKMVHVLEEKVISQTPLHVSNDYNIDNTVSDCSVEASDDNYISEPMEALADEFNELSNEIARDSDISSPSECLFTSEQAQEGSIIITDIIDKISLLGNMMHLRALEMTNKLPRIKSFVEFSECSEKIKRVLTKARQNIDHISKEWELESKRFQELNSIVAETESESDDVIEPMPVLANDSESDEVKEPIPVLANGSKSDKRNEQIPVLGHDSESDDVHEPVLANESKSDEVIESDKLNKQIPVLVHESGSDEVKEPNPVLANESEAEEVIEPTTALVNESESEELKELKPALANEYPSHDEPAIETPNVDPEVKSEENDLKLELTDDSQGTIIYDVETQLFAQSESNLSMKIDIDEPNIQEIIRASTTAVISEPIEQQRDLKDELLNSSSDSEQDEKADEIQRTKSASSKDMEQEKALHRRSQTIHSCSTEAGDSGMDVDDIPSAVDDSDTEFDKILDKEIEEMCGETKKTSTDSSSVLSKSSKNSKNQSHKTSSKVDKKSNGSITSKLSNHSDDKMKLEPRVCVERMDDVLLNRFLNNCSDENKRLNVEIDTLTNLTTLKRARRTSSRASNGSSIGKPAKKKYKSKSVVSNSCSSSSDSGDSKTSSHSTFNVDQRQTGKSSADYNNDVKNLLLKDDSSLDSNHSLSDEIKPVKTNKKRNVEKSNKSSVKDSDETASELEGSNPDTDYGEIWRRANLLTQNLTFTSNDDKFDALKANGSGTKKRWRPNDPIVIGTDTDSTDSDIDKSSLEYLFKKQTKKSRKTRKVKKEDTSIRIISPDSDVRIMDESEDFDSFERRKKIRDVITDDQLAEDTKRANKEEDERISRLTQRQTMLSQILSQTSASSQNDEDNSLVLDFDNKTKEPIVWVHRGLVKHLKQHQKEGIRFMWDSCYESVERINSKNCLGSGCILAHCMGLGKTLQIIALAHTILYNEKCKTKRILVVCPLTTVLNWAEEIKKWLQPLGPDNQIKVYNLNTVQDNSKRAKVLTKWHRGGGILILGYTKFRFLVNNESSDEVTNRITHALVDPGPDLVICDEGHALKNDKAAVTKAMNKIKTKRRIVLTGTPMQNNLKEYYCMVNFVKPNLLGTQKEYSNRFVNPIVSGQHKDSSDGDIKVMKRRSHVLHKLLAGCVQRRETAILAPYLPPKYEYVLLCPLSATQRQLYTHYMKHHAQKLPDPDDCVEKIKNAGINLLADFQIMKMIWTHPRALYTSLVKKQREEEKLKLKGKFGKNAVREDMDESSDNDYNLLSEIQGEPSRRRRKPKPKVPWVRPDWWCSVLDKSSLETLESSSKFLVMFDILRECQNNDEKVLVFSTSINVLDTIEHILKHITELTEKESSGEYPSDDFGLSGHRGIWKRGQDYFRIDGMVKSEIRIESCKIFNNEENRRARLFIISTKAGGLGINMIGANRVILLDTSWNPSDDIQSIFRAYRLQQKKTCYVYRLLTFGTMEQKIYERSVTKQAVSCRVVDEHQIDRHYNMADLVELYVFNEPTWPRPVPKVPVDDMLATMLHTRENQIYTYHEHDSLLQNLQEEELDEAERKAAWADFEREKNISLRNVGNDDGFDEYQQLMMGYASRMPFGLDTMENMYSDYRNSHLNLQREYNMPNAALNKFKTPTTTAVIDITGFTNVRNAPSTSRGIQNNAVSISQAATSVHSTVKNYATSSGGPAANYNGIRVRSSSELGVPSRLTVNDRNGIQVTAANNFGTSASNTDRHHSHNMTQQTKVFTGRALPQSTVRPVSKRNTNAAIRNPVPRMLPIALAHATRPPIRGHVNNSIVTRAPYQRINRSVRPSYIAQNVPANGGFVNPPQIQMASVPIVSSALAPIHNGQNEQLIVNSEGKSEDEVIAELLKSYEEQRRQRELEEREDSSLQTFLSQIEAPTRAGEQVLPDI